MKISKKSLGKQHSLISVQLIEKDYSEKVNEILVNYSKTANMPGFRKGHIPLVLVKKQWGANLSKFNGVAMIGGVTLNGQQIYSEALQDVEKLETEIRSSFELNPAMLIG